MGKGKSRHNLDKPQNKRGGFCQWYEEYLSGHAACEGGYRTIKDDIDLGKDVAAQFGGGGHPKAAGSQFDKTLQLQIIQKIFGE